jgi:hypothetical protein
VFENRVLRRIFGRLRDEGSVGIVRSRTKGHGVCFVCFLRDEVTESWRNLHNEEFMICTLRQVQLELSCQEE